MQSQILIVDDEVEIAQTFADYLKLSNEPFTIHLAFSGQQAMQILEQGLHEGHPIDLVLLDWTMPEMNGLTVLKWIRNQPLLHPIRVCMVTVLSGNPRKISAFDSGADDYINKPFNFAEMLARIKTHLRSLHLQRLSEKQNHQLTQLVKISSHISLATDAQAILAYTLESMQSLLDTTLAVAHWRYGQTLQCQCVNDIHNSVTTEQIPNSVVGVGIVGLACAEKTNYLINQPDTHPYLEAESDIPHQLDIRNMIVAPLIVNDHTVGMLVGYDKRGGEFDPFDLELIEYLANFTNIAIDRLIQRRKLLISNAQQKLTTISDAGAEFAHRMNNIAGTIAPQINLVKAQLAQPQFDRTQIIEKLDSIKEQANRLLHGAAEIKAGVESDRLETIDVCLILEQVIDQVRAFSQENAAALTIKKVFASQVPFIEADPRRLQLTFRNIIQNGIDAVGKDGVITVQVQHSAAYIIVSVHDNGQGMTDEAQERLFDLFYTNKKGGWGFGLWRDKLYIEGLGGSIQIKSSPEEGTNVVILIPNSTNVQQIT